VLLSFLYYDGKFLFGRYGKRTSPGTFLQIAGDLDAEPPYGREGVGFSPELKRHLPARLPGGHVNSPAAEAFKIDVHRAASGTRMNARLPSSLHRNSLPMSFRASITRNVRGLSNFDNESCRD